MSGARTVALAAGGTGGHLFPAISLARALLARGAHPILVTDRRGAALPAELAALETHRVHAGGIASGTLLHRIGGLAKILFGIFEARRLFSRLTPSAAIGFGGYASVPPLLAAMRAGVPTMIHEQNAVLGRANRLLAPRVNRIATAFAEVAGLRAADKNKMHRTGNPVRPEIAAMAGTPYVTPAAAGPLNLLVFGGSQGAAIFSRVVPQAVAALPVALRARIRIAQQCRAEHLDETAAAYRARDQAAEVSTFFADMPQRFAWAHLVMARAGASTTAELACAGRPAILVPYAASADDHQTANARAIVRAGGGWMLPEAELTPSRLAAELEARLSDTDGLAAAAARIAALAEPRAAEALADLVMALLDAERRAA
ncbi:MAG: undecaprenyldiphospho-muramoylpentapeptide beta-N-acetylglucosaminyltransferase [Alphaproteobacteria bacterium]